MRPCCSCGRLRAPPPRRNPRRSRRARRRGWRRRYPAPASGASAAARLRPGGGQEHRRAERHDARIDRDRARRRERHAQRAHRARRGSGRQLAEEDVARVGVEQLLASLSGLAAIQALMPCIDGCLRRQLALLHQTSGRSTGTDGRSGRRSRRARVSPVSAARRGPIPGPAGRRRRPRCPPTASSLPLAARAFSISARL